VDVVIGAPIAALALLAMRHFRRWWIALWLGSVPLIILGINGDAADHRSFFNAFEPLKDPVLRHDRRRSLRAGIEAVVCTRSIDRSRRRP
jgi:hypothetical protein